MALRGVAVVGGGSGTIGSGIIRQLLKRGAAKVIAPVRSPKAAEQLVASFAGVGTGVVEPVVCDVSTEAGAAVLGSHLDAVGSDLTYGVSCFGSYWGKGPLTQQPLSEFNAQITNLAGSHFVFAKTVLPRLAKNESSSFVFVVGTAGEFIWDANVSLMVVGAAALYGVILAAQKEFADTPVRVNEFRLGTWVARHEEVKDGFQSNRKVGNVVADLLLDEDKKGAQLRGTPELVSAAPDE